MKTREEWCQIFEMVVGRVPTEVELLAAEESRFNPKAILPISEGRVFKEAEEELTQVIAEETANAQFLENKEPNEKSTSSMESTDDLTSRKSKEIKAVPIVSFVISGLTILLSLLVKSPLVLLLLSLLSLTFGIISLTINLKKSQKVLSWIALPLSIGALAVAGSVGIYYATFDRVASIVRNVDRSNNGFDQDMWKDDWEDWPEDVEIYVDEQAPFRWTEARFRSLKFGNLNTGTEGMILDELIQVYGKANEASVSDGYLDLTYIGKADEDYVTLYFEQDELGNWILSSGSMSLGSMDLKTQPEESYQSTWTEEAFDKLIEADYDKPELGSSWNDIHKNFGNPTSGEYLLSNFGDGFEMNLDLYYTDQSPDSGKLSDVNLYFSEKNGNYFLTYKFYE
ncbi:hypothetical protein [Streptococcus porci]|uniref:hypothetical protein n=1 Tax=Streptococcus porci TaxID=502567 RepID=UPI000405600B|nr:hypothetical protein [Streptococcus porci]